ncbi:MAG: threonine synthase [Alphaproteobacteria bacterium]|nr:threonine synthase [Alphaproteobacteria bacterium]
MNYVSTRGQAPVLGFEDVLLTGLASDGGLYVPETWPVLKQSEIRALRGRPYADVAHAVLSPLVGDAFAPAELKSMIDEAYATFSHQAVVPLKQLSEDLWLLELFHGPTLAFKDVAMQLLARMMDAALTRRGQRATVIGATSGDTGGAAIEAFRGRKAVDIFILHPHGRVSEVQRRQMTTVPEANVHNIAVEGTFDDCQNMVKAMFGDTAFRRNMALAGVNSINWARIMAQAVYYFTSALALGGPDRPVRYVVPSGNFGDIFAGYVAKQMGLPVEQLVIATNVNDILARTVHTGRYEITGVVETSSPSMDIQISSNFERLLFEVHGRNADSVQRLMSSLKQSGAFTVESDELVRLQQECGAGTADEAQVGAAIKATFGATGELLDPHSAVGVHVAGQTAHESHVPTVCLATAHAAKFPEAVKSLSGIDVPLPERVVALYEKTERLDVLPNDLAAVQAHIAGNTSVEAGAAA